MTSSYLHIAAVTTSRPDGSSSAAVRTAASLARERGARTQLIELRDLPLVFPEQEPGTFPAPVAEAMAQLTDADVLIFGAAVIRSCVAGLARHWMEVFRDALEGRPIVPIIAAGSGRSHLAADAFRGDLLLHFSAQPIPSVVVTPELDEAELHRRLNAALDGALSLVLAGGRS